MGFAFAMAAFWAASALFRGLLSKARSTTTLATAGLLRIGTAIAAGFTTLVFPDMNGGLLGIFAWISSYAIETVLSGWRLRRIGWFIAVE